MTLATLVPSHNRFRQRCKADCQMLNQDGHPKSVVQHRLAMCHSIGSIARIGQDRSSLTQFDFDICAINLFTLPNSADIAGSETSKQATHRNHRRRDLERHLCICLFLLLPFLDEKAGHVNCPHCSYNCLSLDQRRAAVDDFCEGVPAADIFKKL